MANRHFLAFVLQLIIDEYNTKVTAMLFAVTSSSLYRHSLRIGGLYFGVKGLVQEAECPEGDLVAVGIFYVVGGEEGIGNVC